MNAARAFLASIALLAALGAHAQSLVITTVAGGGVGDFGPATEAPISSPTAIAFDAAGNLFIADAGFQRIRRVARDTGVITTIAGTGDEGFAGDGGPALAAQFSTPAALAFDRDGNLYVADSGNDRIRRIDAATGEIRTFAGGGDGTAGPSPIGDAGPATSAVLAHPSALAMGADGRILYFADQYHARVRRIDLLTGVIDTVAGSGAVGFSGDGGPATAARLNNPAGIAFGPGGDLYIADRNNVRVRKVDARTGVITTVAGGPRLTSLSSGAPAREFLDFDVHAVPFEGEDGPATAAPLLAPSALALDAAGNLFIADVMLARILRVDARTGRINNLAGMGMPDFSGDGGAAKDAGLAYPAGILFDVSGELFVADRDNDVVRRISTDGKISRVAGSGGIFFAGEGGDPRNARLATPQGIAFNSRGELLIVDAGNTRIRKVASNVIRTVAGGGREQRLGCSREGMPATSLRLTFFLKGIAVDAADAALIPFGSNGFVCKLEPNGRIRTFAGNPIGEFSEYFGENGDGYPAIDAGFASVVGVAVTRAGDVFLSDETVGRIRFVSAGDGIIRTIAGDGRNGFRGDGGPAVGARLNRPSYLALGPDGSLYVSDTGNHRVRRIDPSGRIATVAGNGGSGFSGDGGPATAASLSSPEGLAIDAAGDLYIADRANHRIRKVSHATGVIVTIAGTGDAGYSGDGADALAATLSSPTGLAFDATGDLHISDSSNGRIRKLSPGGQGTAK